MIPSETLAEWITGALPDAIDLLGGGSHDEAEGVVAEEELIFEWADWLPYLADTEASEDEKREMIETVWAIVMSFADLGWEVRGDLKPGEKTCGKVIDLKAALASAMLHSDHQPKLESEEV